MKDIILYGHSGSGNHGCEAIIRSTLKVLGCDCVVYSSNPDQDKKYGLIGDIKNYSLRINPNSLRRYFYAVYCRIFSNSMIRYKYLYKPFLDSITEGKIYLSVGGDHYCYGSYSNHIYDFLSNTIKSKGSKSVLWSCSIESKDLDKHTIQSLKKYDLITARESITYQNLMDIGIDKNVVLIPDVAFQLPTENVELPENLSKENTIGINISPMIQKYGENKEIVFKNYENLISYILKNTTCSVALIPHVVWSDIDDRIPLQTLYHRFQNSGRVVLIEDRPAQEMKGIISQCCFFIGARTHATIAAYSSCVPTLVIGYSIKARGIAKDIFGQEEGYVLPVQSMNSADDLTTAFQKLWDKRDEIANYLRDFMPQYCERVWDARKVLQDL